MAVATTMATIIVTAVIVLRRPTCHRRLDEFHVLGLCAPSPGRVRPLHSRDAVTILVGNQQPIVADHQPQDSFALTFGTHWVPMKCTEILKARVSADIKVDAKALADRELRVPEAMVKVLSSGSNDLGAVARHLDYINRHGKLPLETDDGDRLTGDIG